MVDEASSTNDLISVSEIDRIIHEPARLIIMAHLYVVESAYFLFRMQQMDFSFGNLSSHMSKLEQAGFISVQKEFVDRKPHTMLSLTKSGREAFKDYRKRMRSLFEDMPD